MEVGRTTYGLYDMFVALEEGKGRAFIGIGGRNVFDPLDTRFRMRRLSLSQAGSLRQHLEQQIRKREPSVILRCFDRPRLVSIALAEELFALLGKALPEVRQLEALYRKDS